MTAIEDVRGSELLSWIDVARRISYVPTQGEGSPPAGVLSSVAYWSGLTVRAQTSTPAGQIVKWLETVFGSWLVHQQTGELYIRLDAPSAMARLPVKLTFLNDDDVKQTVFKPHAALESERAFHASFPDRSLNDEIPVYAFHSVKGGVGRTTSAIAFALDRQPGEPEGPVLLVDADFEAPGISFLLRSRKAHSTVSFEDLLALAHADGSDDFEASLKFVAERMIDQRVDNVFVLPAKRLLADLAGFAIRPENLLSARRDDPYVVVDLVRSLAKRLGCRKCVVDLRAGLVDVAVQFLSDPSVDRIFVSTVAGQSIAALQSMIRTLGQIERETGVAGRQPLVIFNQVPLFRLGDTAYRGELIQNILSTSEGSFLPQGQTEDISVKFAFVPHLGDLVAAAGDWDTFSKELAVSSFSKVLTTEIRGWSGLEHLQNTVDSDAGPIVSVAAHDQQCRLLHEYAEKLEVAETAADIEQPLATPPLQRLASDFLSQPPIVVVEGAKGTGKTLTARFLLERGGWKSAVAQLDANLSANFEGSFLPVFASVASSDAMLELVRAGRANLSKLLKAPAASSSFSETEQAIKARVAEGDGGRPWLDFWLDEIARAAGFRGVDGWSRFVEAARSADTKPVILVEGLEEVLTDPFTNSTQANALRSLLREVPLRLREEAGRPLGYIAFMRGDMVEATMVQNLVQFRAGYSSYALTWREDDIKELVVWLVSKSGAIPGVWHSEWRDAPVERQDADLRKIWGLKLGADDSREARSTEWVIAVLTDLTGRLTARDLVRFVGQAAKASRGNQHGSDRLLSAVALKSAVDHTSRMKVDEYPKEVRQLQNIFEKLKQHPGFETPFVRSQAAEINITESELDILETYGVAYQEDGRFEVPELFRIGLNMKRGGARPNIISLTRRARERARA